MPPTNQSTPKVVHQEQSRPITPPPDGAQSSPPETKQSDSQTSQSTTKASPDRGRKRKVPHQDHLRATSPSPDRAQSSSSTPETTLAAAREEDRKTAELPGHSSDCTTSIVVPDNADADSPLLALRAFFETKMTTLHKGKGHTPSAHTREPGFFDTHLEPILRLKRVVRLPAIEKDLKTVAAQAVHAFPVQQFPPLHESFPTQDVMKNLSRDISEIIIQGEGEVLDIYSKIAKQCAFVAGTLAYPDSETSWNSTLLKWTTSPMEEKKDGPIAKNQATPDGVLNFVDAAKESKARHLISKYGLHVLVLAEFKNLNFCDGERLLRVVKQFCKGEFPWATCKDGVKCRHKKKPTEHIVSWDAADHPCPSMKDAREKSKAQEANPRVSTFSEGARDILQQAWASAVRYDATFIIIHAGNSEIIAIRDRQTQTFYLSDVIRVDTCENYLQMHVGIFLAAIRDAEDRAGVRSSQQEHPPTWNPLGKDNCELDLSEKSHRKFKAALLKATSSRPWLAITPKKNEFYHPFTQDLYHRVQSPDDIIISECPSPRESQSSQEYSPVTLETLCELSRSSSSDSAQFSLERYGVGAVNPTPNTRFELQDLDEPSFSGHRICRAVLRFNDVKKPPSFPFAKFPTLVIKNATEPHHIAGLQEEYRVIKALRQKDALRVPKIYGLFRCPDADDPDKQFVALVLEDLGQSLDGMSRSYRKTNRKRAKVSIPSEDAARIMDILESWHRAGYIHSSLSKKRIVVLSDGGSTTKRFSIVGFRHAESIVGLDSAERQMKIDDNNELLRRVLGQR
ncbi:hypothetical protein H0H93_000265 [Arthromyces matolae]|nr:hypothetical protein H0H93_000265 [Arthromyces matolae]